MHDFFAVQQKITLLVAVMYDFSCNTAKDRIINCCIARKFLKFGQNYIGMTTKKLIGRSEQVKELRKYVDSSQSEFIAVYGRRRVGKTFLIRETFQNKFSFSVSGIHGGSKREQLTNFAIALQRYANTEEIHVRDSWLLAFHDLTKYLEKLPEGPKILFIDELPWIETHKSGFVRALENFWNGWASARDDIKLIICGSATSWIINKIIRNRGGLHNRVTHRMLVSPFHLKECEEYFKAYDFAYTKKQIAECYMAMGGIPYYLSLMDNSVSVAQNIDKLFFSDNGELRDEFHELYASLFKNSLPYINIVEGLAKKGIGLTRKEIIETTKLDDNGSLSTMLEELELCGFIRRYKPFRKAVDKRKSGKRNESDSIYQLIDFYTIFYFKFLQNRDSDNSNFWVQNYSSPKLNTWKGLAFEQLCLYHDLEIKRVLGISGIQSSICSWYCRTEESSCRIDLVINRGDDAINLCEMKYCDGEFRIDKSYYENLENKLWRFRQATGTEKALILTFVTSHGLLKNKYSHLVQSSVELVQLFE